MSETPTDGLTEAEREEITVRREAEVHTRRMAEIRAMSLEALDDLRRGLVAKAETAWPTWVVLERCGALQELARIDTVLRLREIKLALAAGRTPASLESPVQSLSILERELARFKPLVRVNALLLSRDLGALRPA